MGDGGEWSRGNSHRHSYGSEDSNSDVVSDDDTFADEDFGGFEDDAVPVSSSDKLKKKKKKKSRSSIKSKGKKKKKKDDESGDVGDDSGRKLKSTKSTKVSSKSPKKKKKSKESVTAVEDEKGSDEVGKSKSPKKKKKSKENVNADDDKPKKKKKHSKKDKTKETNGVVDEPPESPKSPKSPKKKSKKMEKKEKSNKGKSCGSEEEPAEQVHFVDNPVEEGKDDDSEAERMKNMLAQWDDSDEDDSSSDSSDEDVADNDDEEILLDRKMTKDELGLKDSEIDHIILAAPNYEEAVKEFETMTGIKPARMGGLKGLGIRAARVATDNNCYIEILAPDPVKAGPIGAKLAELEEGTLIPYHYAIRQRNLDDLQHEFVPNELGYVPDRINLFSPSPDGLPAKWGMLFMQGHFIGGVVPYYVDWGGCAHPISSIPNVGPLKSLTITAPGGSQVHSILKGIDMVTTQVGDPAMEFSIGTPEGTITFSGENPLGLVFPGAGDPPQEVASPENPKLLSTSENDSDSEDGSLSSRSHAESSDESASESEADSDGDESPTSARDGVSDKDGDPELVEGGSDEEKPSAVANEDIDVKKNDSEREGDDDRLSNSEEDERMKKMMADGENDSDEDKGEEGTVDKKESVKIIDEVLSSDDEGEENIEEVVEEESDFEEEIIVEE